MKQITNCYANWRIDAVILLGIIALILLSDESNTILANIIGVALLIVDILLAHSWRKAGKMNELDNITE